jgi:hypothetical protein
MSEVSVRCTRASTIRWMVARNVENVKAFDLPDEPAVRSACRQYTEFLRWPFGGGNAPAGLAMAETATAELCSGQ